MILIWWWGVEVGAFRACWYDLWTKRFCFEVAWNSRRFIRFRC